MASDLTRNPAMATMQFWLNQEMRKVNSTCVSNQTRIPHTSQIEDVVKLTDVHLRPELRALRGSISGLRSLEQAAQTQLNKLIDTGLQAIQSKATPEEALQARGRFMQKCEPLRGKYGMLWRRADMESMRIVHQKKNEAPPPDALQ